MGTEVGILNTAVSHCFQDLSECTSIRYEAFVDPNAWGEALRTWKQTGRRGRLPVDVHVYGSRDTAEAAGKVFSRARLYFQHPSHCGNSTKYENPHYLSFSNIPISESPLLTSWSASVYQTERSSKCNISKVLENLDQQEYVRQANIDSRVRTPMLRFVLLYCHWFPFHDHVLTFIITSQPSERRCRFYNATRGRNCSICFVTLEASPENIDTLLVSCLDHYIPADAKLNNSHSKC